MFELGNRGQGSLLCVTSLRVVLPTGGPCVNDGNDERRAVKAHNAFAALEGMPVMVVEEGGCMVIYFQIWPSPAAWAAHGLT